jgi:hypothetical protein
MAPMSSPDRRDSFRLDLEPGRAVVTVGGGARVEVRDLSASGGSLVIRGGAPTSAELLQGLLELDGGETFRADFEVVRVRSQQEGVIELGTRFGGLEGESLHKLSRFITREHHRQTSDPARLMGGSPSLKVTNPLFILNLLRRDPACERLMFVVDGNVRLPAVLRVDGLAFHEGSRVVRCSFVSDAATLPPGRAYTFVLSGAGAATVFESTCSRQRGLSVLLAVPTEVRQTGFRESPRVPLSHARLADVAFLHPRLLGERMGGPLFDVAGRGISFPVDSFDHSLFPGDRLAGIRVNLPEGIVEAEGIVRTIANRSGQQHLSCGVQLIDFGGHNDADRWQHFVFKQMHPNLNDGGAEDAWRVLESSRYVDLWTPGAQRERIRRYFFASWDHPRPEVGHALVLETDKRPVGLSAGSLVYPSTWLLHHLGVGPSADGAQNPLVRASELISGILFRLKERRDLDHFLIYVESGKRWNDRLYGDFADRYFDTEKLLYSPLHLYRWVAADTGALGEGELSPRNESLEVVPADANRWSELAGHLGRTLTPIEVRSFGFDASCIDLGAFSAGCAARGHERQRAAFFALVGGRPVAALVAESGSEGTNIFGLLNTCRILPLSQSAPTPAVRRELLKAAVAHYRALGKQSFLLFEEAAATDGVPGQLGLVPVSGGMRWLAHRDVIPAWAAYLKGLLTAVDTSAEREGAVVADTARSASDRRVQG